LAFALFLTLAACQPVSKSITILDGEKIINLNSSERVPLVILTQAGIAPSMDDRVFVNGIPRTLEDAITEGGAIQLQLRRAVTLTLVTSDGGQEIRTSALTVGEALTDAGFSLSIHDDVLPPPDSPILGPMTVSLTHARDLFVATGGEVIHIRSAAGTVGEALAQAGIPLVGLDTSRPAEHEAPPADGQIQVTRVTESIRVELEAIPFETE